MGPDPAPFHGWLQVGGVNVTANTSGWYLPVTANTHPHSGTGVTLASGDTITFTLKTTLDDATRDEPPDELELTW